MLQKKYRYLTSLFGIIAIFSLLNLSSCTKLDEKVFGSKEVDIRSGGGGGTSTAADLIGVYDQLNQFADQANAYALTEHPSDEMMGPTRGTDWDDFGTWRKLHAHTWDASHNQIYSAWNNLNGAAYRATVVTETATDPQIKAEAAFLRAFFTYQVVDLFGQVPYRASTAAADDIPIVYSRKDAVAFMEKDLASALAVLPSTPNQNRATAVAVNFLSAKIALNKAVFTQDPSSPAGPFTFAPADMNNVITLCNKIIAISTLKLTPNYWDNFKWDNATKSSEIIFARENTASNQPANVKNRTYMGFHYNQIPSGWNGFTTLADFYNSFSSADIRKGTTFPGFTDSLGYGAGFLVGQQYGPKMEKDQFIRNPNGTRKLFALTQRDGNPLVFTPDASLSFSTEAQGIRVVKYPLNPDAIDASTNSYIFFRFADVLLMKAEAILRGGTDPNGQTALAIVNTIRSNRGTSALDKVDLPILLQERGFELYYEGWRRNDQIRFGTFNDPVNERPTKSGAFRVVFPIPVQAVSTNPNLKQNFGY